VNDEVLAHWGVLRQKQTKNKHYSCDRIKENEMGLACGTYGGKREFHLEFYGEI
jgi:hypothetical protein